MNYLAPIRLFMGPFLLLLMGATFSGCDDNSTPASTVVAAYHAVETKHLSDLRLVLSGEALGQYGSSEGLEELKITLEQYHDPQPGEAQLTWADRNCDYCDNHKHYLVPISGVPKSGGARTRIWTANIHCGSTHFHKSGDTVTRCTIDSLD